EHAHDSCTLFQKLEKSDIEAKQRYFNYTLELIREVIKPMMEEGKETTAAMGDDTPLAAFSNEHRNFTDFFKQKFAQVTNPPIDPIREKVVMSLNTGFGETGNILADVPEHAKRLKTVSPIMSREKFQLLKEFGTQGNKRYDAAYHQKAYDTAFSSGLKSSLDNLVERIVADVRDNAIRVIILDDRSMSQDAPAIPMLMVVGRLTQVLKDNDLKHLTSIVVVTGEVFDPHSAACMIAYGATTVFPYLLYYTVKKIETRDNDGVDMTPVLKKFRRAMSSGLLKIMSKMGISTISSYRSSRLFDVIGLSDEIVSDCFLGSHGLLCGLGYDEIEKRIFSSARDAYGVSDNDNYFPLEKGGYYKFKKNEEFHDYSKNTIDAMHRLSYSGEREDFEAFKVLVDKRDKKFIRDFYELQSDREPISIDKVEPLSEIFKRFSSAAMSMGSISPEAHECLAEAMNTIGAKSNSGEGGEDAFRYGTILNSKIKQVASGRFGVTPAYLRSADEIQIKVAQGAKPGEGGQLPGPKVTALIAKLRHTKA
ncbi:MAG TPA: glutamate synthase large subunit, partial [Sulfurovum sp.]|nr:glutamate synthase large subunit [Sulfurovum sp.]